MSQANSSNKDVLTQLTQRSDDQNSNSLRDELSECRTPPPPRKSSEDSVASDADSLSSGQIISKTLDGTLPPPRILHTHSLTTETSTVPSKVTPSESDIFFPEAKRAKKKDEMWQFFKPRPEGKVKASSSDGKGLFQGSKPSAKLSKEEEEDDDDDDYCVILEKAEVEVMAKLDRTPVLDQICTDCGNKGYLCQDVRYRRYCLKAVYSYLRSSVRNCGWAKPMGIGVDPDTVSGVFIQAYNEKRRSDIKERFRYYIPNKMDLPGCVRKLSYQDALNLGNKTVLMNIIKTCNENGYKNFSLAKQQNWA